MVAAFETVYRLLKSGAKLFARMGTPYGGLWTRECMQQWADEIRVYLNESTMNKHSRRPYPVQITNVRETIDMQKLANVNSPESETLLSSNCTFFLFDADVTKLMLESCNFIVEKCEYESMKSSPFENDGRERLIVIARNPE